MHWGFDSDGRQGVKLPAMAKALPPGKKSPRRGDHSCVRLLGFGIKDEPPRWGRRFSDIKFESLSKVILSSASLQLMEMIVGLSSKVEAQ